MEVSDKALRDAGYTNKAINHPSDEEALILLCAFVGVDPKVAPPAWWFQPNEASKLAWKRVADKAKELYGINGKTDENN